MKLHVLSDLHMEFGEIAVPTTDADVVVLAGDIHTGSRGLDWIRRSLPRIPVVYVIGNHEFYGHSLPALTDSLKGECNGSNIHILANDSVRLFGYRFLGCTLWTDFALRGDAGESMRTAGALMTDYRLIQNSLENRLLLPRDTASQHRFSRAWLGNELAESDRSKTIVITHHAPSPRSESSQYQESPLAPAFSSNLDAFVKQSGAPLWIHGHTHNNVDYRIGCTRIISNQRGYPHQLCSNYRPQLTIEV